MDLIVPTWRLFFLLSNRVSVILLPVLRRNAEVDVTWILIWNNSLMKNIVFGRFQMGVFSPENKVRLCAAIFTALIFLDIIAFFDTLSPDSPMLGFCKRQSASSVPLGLRHNYKGQSYDIETTNSSSQNYTKSMEYEMKEEGEFHGEMVHDVAVLLVEVLGLAILLVANSYIYSNISAKLSFDIYLIYLNPAGCERDCPAWDQKEKGALACPLALCLHHWDWKVRTQMEYKCGILC